MKKRPMQVVLEELVNMSQQPMDDDLRALAQPGPAGVYGSEQPKVLEEDDDLSALEDDDEDEG